MMRDHPVALLWRIVHGHRGAIVAGILLSCLQAAATLPVARYVRRIFDTALPARDTSGLVGQALAILGLLGLAVAISLVGRHVVMRAVKTSINQLRTELFAKIHVLPRAYYDQHDKFRVHETIVHDTERIDSLANSIFGQLVPALVVAVLLSGVAAWLNWRLFAVMAVVFPLVFLCNRLSLRRQREALSESRRHHYDAGRGVMQALRYMELTRLHSAADQIQAAQGERFRRHLDASLKSGLIQSIHQRVQQYAMVLPSILIVLAGGISVSHGRMSVGELISFYAVVGLMSNYLREIAAAANQIVATREPLFAVSHFMHLAVESPYNGTQKFDFRGALSFVDVTFGYRDGPVILSGINLQLQPETVTALMGANGSGKSTLVHLILGSYRPLSGHVMAGGRRYDDLDLADLRRHIGIVVQDPVIVDGSMRENILYGRPDASEAEMRQAATLATAHEFIVQLPTGYESRVGDAGVLLSGGQRQRLALARALLGRPAVLVFDEPTNHLDVDATLRLIRNIRALQPAPTILIVTHNEAVVRVADEVLEASGGTIQRRDRAEERASPSKIFAAT